MAVMATGEPLRHDGGDAITVAGVTVPPGTRQRIDVPVARSYGRDSVLPVVVVNGRRPGPRMFVSAAIHGDEINGVEIVRRLLAMPVLKRLRGALLAVPVVNVYGFTAQSRYLPDRRDLNRAFPGSPTGSVAARLAHAFMSEVVSHCSLGIDLHTGSHHRANLPQIRACVDDPETADLAMAFGVPVVLNSNLRDGSLRQAVLERGVPVLLYEAGEALRFDEVAIRAGVRGVISVMRFVGMLRGTGRSQVSPLIARRSLWVRAPSSGTLRNHVALGARVDADAHLGWVADPFGGEETAVVAPSAGDYALRVSGNGQYLLTVTKGASFDREINDGTDRAQDLSHTGNALGHLLDGPDRGTPGEGRPIRVVEVDTSNPPLNENALINQLNNDTHFDFEAVRVTVEQADTLAELLQYDVVPDAGHPYVAGGIPRWPVIAPVRISVIAVASSRARGIPVFGSKRLSRAISEGRPCL